MPCQLSCYPAPVEEANQVLQQSLSLPLREARELFEREYMTSQLQKFEGNISQMAKFIGMERSALHRKLKSLKVDPCNLLLSLADRKTARMADLPNLPDCGITRQIL